MGGWPLRSIKRPTPDRDNSQRHWVGLLYTPDMKMKTQIIRSELEVHAWGDY
jgi:hypothetical protein